VTTLGILVIKTFKVASH